MRDVEKILTLLEYLNDFCDARYVQRRKRVVQCIEALAVQTRICKKSYKKVVFPNFGCLKELFKQFCAQNANVILNT